MSEQTLKASTKLAWLFLAIFTLQGCGIQFWYNRLPWVSTWYADDYVTLTSSQEERIEALVEKHADWHRATQLPLYNQFIDDVIADLKNKTIAKNYDSYGERLLGFYHSILDRTLDDAVSELSMLSDEQVSELMDNITASAKNDSEDYLDKDDEERLEDATENALDTYEEWLNDLTDEQEAMIIETVKQLKPTGKLRLEYLKRWREAFKLALDERKTESGQKALYSLLRDPRQLRTPEHIAQSEFNNSLRKSLQLKLFESADEEQIEHFAEYLDDYREDFLDLIEDAE